MSPQLVEDALIFTTHCYYRQCVDKLEPDVCDQMFKLQLVMQIQMNLWVELRKEYLQILYSWLTKPWNHYICQHIMIPYLRHRVLKTYKKVARNKNKSFQIHNQNILLAVAEQPLPVSAMPSTLHGYTLLPFACLTAPNLTILSLQTSDRGTVSIFLFFIDRCTHLWDLLQNTKSPVDMVERLNTPPIKGSLGSDFSSCLGSDGATFLDLPFLTHLLQTAS